MGYIDLSLDKRSHVVSKYREDRLLGLITAS
jgi:hypothetical protein